MRARVRAWVIATLGEACFLDRRERGARLLEEAVEAAQSEGVPPEQARRILERAYARPAGLTFQEVGGVMVTLLALCASAGISPDDAFAEEIERIEHPEVAARVRAKQAEKAAAGTGVLPGIVP